MWETTARPPACAGRCRSTMRERPPRTPRSSRTGSWWAGCTRARPPPRWASGRPAMLARVPPAHQDPVLDERGVLGGRSLIVERQRPAQAGGRAVVSHIEDRLPEAAAQDHHLARLRVLVHEVCFREVPERLVDEHAGQLGIEDHGIGAALHHRRVEQLHRPLRDLAEPRRLRSEEHTSELQSRLHLVCRLLLEKKKKTKNTN